MAAISRITFETVPVRKISGKKTNREEGFKNHMITPSDERFIDELALGDIDAAAIVQKSDIVKKLSDIRFEEGIAYDSDKPFTGKIIDTVKNGDNIELNYKNGKIINARRSNGNSTDFRKEFWINSIDGNNSIWWRNNRCDQFYVYKQKDDGGYELDEMLADKPLRSMKKVDDENNIFEISIYHDDGYTETSTYKFEDKKPAKKAHKFFGRYIWF